MNRFESAGPSNRFKQRMTRGVLMVIALGMLAVSVDAAVGKLGKLKKKVAELEASVEAKQTQLESAEAELPIEEQALSDGQTAQALAALLPRTTKAEKKIAKKATEVANKAVKRATKRINKLTQKVAILEARIAKNLGTITELELAIEELGLGGFPGAGEIGVPGLGLPALMTMVEATAVSEGAFGSTTQVGQSSPAVMFLSVPQRSDYVMDEATTWVWDPSLKSLESVNEILSVIRQAAHDALVNEGAYVAQVNPNLRRDGAASSGQQGETEEVELWTVNSQRGNETKSNVVGAWIPQGEDDETASTLQVRVVIAEEPDENNPYGVFSLDFESSATGDETDESFFWGTLETVDGSTGATGFSFYETGENSNKHESFERAVHVSIDADGAGVAKVFETVTGAFGGDESEQTVENSFWLAFDENNLLRQQGASSAECLDRDQFETSVWNYNLYESSGLEAGSLVTRSSGFGIATAGGEYGWVGYDGLWLESEAPLLSGEVVAKNTVDSGDSPEQFTVMRSPGKLLRFSKSTLALVGIDGMQFEWAGDPSEVAPVTPQVGGGVFGGRPSSDSSLVNYLVEYNHGTGQFVAIGTLDDDHQVSSLSPQIVLDTSELGFLDLWSSSLGGSVAYVHGENSVTYFAEEIVSGNDAIFSAGGSVHLYAYVDALASEITGAEAAHGWVFLPDADQVGMPHVFVMDRDDLALYHDVAGDGSVLNRVGLGVDQSYDSGPFAWGMRSGPMVTDTGSLSDPLDVWNQSVFYVYETGPNDWNSHTTLINNSGDFVEFEAPVQFTYRHSSGADRNSSSQFEGQVFQLQFHGPGDLRGIPLEGVDVDGDGTEDRWYPAFNLSDGTLLGPTGTEYLVRGIEMEQRLATDAAGCVGLNLGSASLLSLPDGSHFVQPNLGERPVMSGPAAVIAGVVQED